MKVMIVDDSSAMRMIVKRTLKQAGFDGLDIVEADDGSTALEMIKSDTPDLVLSDWNMPTMNGIDLLENLNTDGIDVTFGFITTEATPPMRSKADAAGAKFLITKPFTPDTFEETLGKFID